MRVVLAGTAGSAVTAGRLLGGDCWEIAERG